MRGRLTGRLTHRWSHQSPAKPVRVVEYDHDGEFRHLGYTAPLTARSRTAEKAPTALTRRAAKVFATKLNLRDCGVRIVPSVLVPKTVYHFAFGKATGPCIAQQYWTVSGRLGKRGGLLVCHCTVTALPAVLC